jgi:c-di-AMP phosphodiesterase-like protein
MKNTIFGIRLINWALILVAVVYTVLWVERPAFMLETGTSYLILGIYFTLLFVKAKSFSKQEWEDNFVRLKKQLPLLIFMLVMGVLLHRFIGTVYWEPYRQKIIQRFEGNERVKRMFDRNAK